jgi:hypothetical protein
MNIAAASLEECRHVLILSKGLNYGNSDSPRLLLGEVSRLLNAYSRAVLSPVS